MDFLSLPPEVQFSLIAILIVAGIGCITALRSWTRISKETAGVKNAERTLTGDEAWNGAYPHDKLKLEVWLRANGIKPDSHLGDFIRTCWSAWLGGRPASLTELHVLVARRERGHSSTRLSAGISALLLVFGIVGTLSSIKPVLGDFKFKVAAESGSRATGGESEATGNDQQASVDQESEKDAESVAANTDLVNKLINNLGNAFWPSLLALIGTIAVVSCRGLYSLSLHKFALELDRFAVDTLIPRYRVPSLSEQYQEVKATLGSVTESLLHREGRFHEAVEKLEALVAGISPALGGLDAAASASKEAAEKLASGAESITEGMNRHLGEKSPIHRAISGFESIFEKADVSLGNLSFLVDGIGQSNASSQRDLESAIKALTQSVGKIAKDHQSHQSEAKTALREFKDSMADIPEVIQITNGKAVDTGMMAVRSSVEQLHDEQKKWHAASAEELKTTTASGLAGIVRAGQELTAQAEKIAPAVLDVGNIGKDARAAFKEMTDAGKTEITQIGDATKSKIEATSGKLTKEVNNIGIMVERLSKLQLAPVENNGSRRGDLPGRKAASGNGSKDHREPIRNVVIAPTAVERPTISDPIAGPAPIRVLDDIPETVLQTPFADKPALPEITPAPQKMPQQVPQEKSFDDGVDLAESVADPNPEVPAGKWQSLKGFFSRKKS
jgi:hypothetical protein